jgi:hypothetical protein
MPPPVTRSNSVAVLQSPLLRAEESGLARYALTSENTLPTSAIVVSTPNPALTDGDGICAIAGRGPSTPEIRTAHASLNAIGLSMMDYEQSVT